jgi:hypothetical protein
MLRMFLKIMYCWKGIWVIYVEFSQRIKSVFNRCTYPYVETFNISHQPQTALYQY